MAHCTLSAAQLATPLVDALTACAQREQAPFYTPGHKRGQGISPLLRICLGREVFRADLPELPELDNLFAPQTVIQQAQALAAEAFGAERTWFLVNGSTCGLLAAILATCAPNDKIVLPRNVHRSTISGLILAGALPIFLNPDYDRGLDIAHSITPDAVANALLQHPDAKAVLMVSPTYYGVCGDVAAIAQIAHHYAIPLLVDEAHGPHFAFHPELPTSALAAGADLVVQSTHKVLSAMTQAAMLHLQGDRVNPDRISNALQLVQSTSPSYLLLASLDAARHQMATEGVALMAKTLQLADSARSQINQISRLSTLEPPAANSGFALDRTRLTVTVSGLGIDGFAADEILNQLGVTAELPSLQHLTFIISLGNTEADIQQLVKALRVLAEMKQDGKHHPLLLPTPHSPLPTPHSPFLSPRDAFFLPAETLPIEQAINRISAELICPYPPGIPVLMPGEVITAAAIAYLQLIYSSGGMISGGADATLKTLQVVKP